MKSPKTQEMEQKIQDYINRVRSNSPEDCFNSRLLYEIKDVSFEDKTLTISYKTSDWMLNPGGVVHGGMVSTMFDITMGITSMGLSGAYTPTVNLTISFLSPVPNNDHFVVTAHATRVGRTFVQLTAEGWAQSNRTLCATATAIFYCGTQPSIFNDPIKKG